MIFYAKYVIEKSLALLNKYDDSLSDKTDLALTKTRMSTELDAIINGLTEINIATLDSTVNSQLCEYVINDLKEMLKKVARYECSTDAKEDIKKINSIVNPMISYNDYGYNYKCVYAQNIEYNKNTEIGYDCTFGTDVISKLINTNRKINVLHCNGSYSDLAIRIADENKNYNMHTTTKNLLVYRNQKENGIRVVKVSKGGVTISNNVFDVVICQPEISWQVYYNVLNNVMPKKEKMAIVDELKYLREDGVFVYIIPFTRLTKDIAWLLSKNLKDIQIFKGYSNEEVFFAVTGKKRNKGQDPVKEEYDLLSKAYCNLENIPTECIKAYDLPSGMREVKLFRGSEITDSEAIETIATSGLINDFFNSQSKSIGKEESRPLLPFNIGQIGLILTSGCLDGVVKEYDGQYHVIKGKVSKVSNTEDAVNGTESVSLETINNKVQVNILTPNGDYIELA